jgi:hypothetical protein
MSDYLLRTLGPQEVTGLRRATLKSDTQSVRPIPEPARINGQRSTDACDRYSRATADHLRLPARRFG